MDVFVIFSKDALFLVIINVLPFLQTLQNKPYYLKDGVLKLKKYNKIEPDHVSMTNRFGEYL